MSSPASRRRQRQRRRSRQQLWTAQKDLAERQVDLTSYERVIADMGRRQLPPFGGAQAISIVAVCRDAIRHEYAQLAKVVADLERKTPP